MVRRGRSLVAGCVFVLALLGAVSTPASACSSDHPSFQEAVRGARAIARVTIIEGFDSVNDDPTHTETFKVERVLKGSLPGLVTVAPAWTSLCHDTVAYYGGGPGSTIILAVDLRYYHDVIHPMWVFDSAGQNGGSAAVPGGVTTLAGLESAILAELRMPDTSTGGAEQTPAVVPAIVALAIGFIAFVAALLRLRPRGRRGRGSFMP
jgi:hypothetical protein